MPAETLRTGDELRRPEIEVILRPDGLPSYEALIVLRGEHDLGTAEAFRVTLAPLFGDVLVDLGDCDFIDSTVIGALIAKARELEREGYRLECVVPPARETHRMCRHRGRWSSRAGALSSKPRRTSE